MLRRTASCVADMSQVLVSDIPSESILSIRAAMTSCCERMAMRLRTAYHELDQENADLKASEERLAAENLELKAALRDQEEKATAEDDLSVTFADLKASEERLAAENLRLKAALHEIINTALVVMPTTAPLAPTAPTTPLAPTAPTMAPSTAPTSAPADPWDDIFRSRSRSRSPPFSLVD